MIHTDMVAQCLFIDTLERDVGAASTNLHGQYASTINLHGQYATSTFPITHFICPKHFA